MQKVNYIEVPFSIGDPMFYANRQGFTKYKYKGRYFCNSVEITEEEANDET